ncbi:hypothetical protein CU098_007865 [Rhizopus stolonifer]|uniref:AB hydrolase-1 domain-containing protein n=1 Tax=Rhizopus stolonifer TaxID=4846 RepID=A0A367K1C3_RHIST|nr:hypothetical protein CU098_007865 [Rhizopus stolonifer]
MYLVPSSTHIIPVHPSTDGYDVQKLVVDTHSFPGTNSTNKMVFMFSHSNGFHKESLHPLMKRLVDSLRTIKAYDQTDLLLVSWDARNHGDSARLNQGTFLNSYRWFDNAMDTKQVVDQLKLKDHLLILVGHSFGASSAILCEFFFPNTFDGLCVIEPVMSNIFLDAKLASQVPVLASLRRRDEWPTREACRASLLTKKFFQLLHPEVLDLYEYGMYDTEQGTVKLKCPREQEYHVFRYATYDTNTARRSLALIKVPIHFVYALGSSFVRRQDAASVINLNKDRITLEFVEGTHMAPNETPDIIVPHILKTIKRVHKEKTNISRL